MAEQKLPEHEQLYTIKEAAGLMRVFHKTLYTWAYAGRLRTVRIGRKQLVPASEIDRIIRDGLNK